MGTLHDTLMELFVKLFKALRQGTTYDVIEIGKALEEAGADNLINGGFWIWNIKTNDEYYSRKFFDSLGYESKPEKYKAEFWQKTIEKASLDIAIENFENHIKTKGTHPYDQVVTYNKKYGGKVELVCSGTIIKEHGEPIIMVGTHRLLK